MSSKAEIIRELRLHPAFKKKEEDHESGFIAPGLDFKIKHGALVALTGSSAAEFAVAFFVMNPHFTIYICEKEQRIFPPYLAQRGLEVGSIPFGTYGTNLADAVRDLLRSDLYDLIFTPNEFDDPCLDKFGRLARDHDTLLLMVSKNKQKISSHIDLHLDVHRGNEKGSFRHEVKKHKYGRV